MDIQVVETAAFGVAAKAIWEAVVREQPDAVIGVPTGNTPLALYRELRARGETAASCRWVMLDDYLHGGEVSSRRWLQRELFGPLRVGGGQILAMPEDSSGCAQFEQQLQAWGGCDLQFLGLGWNGHIGFNEPGSPPDSRTRLVRLTPETRALNRAYWPGLEVPEEAVTMGIGTILDARHICLLVNGSAKEAILGRVLHEPMTDALPASWLRRAPRLTVIADQEAATAIR